MDRQTNRSGIYKIEFFEPVKGKTEYFFGSLKAIFVSFGPDEIGCSLSRLYTSKVTEDSPKITNKCIIRRVQVERMQRNK